MNSGFPPARMRAMISRDVAAISSTSLPSIRVTGRPSASARAPTSPEVMSDVLVVAEYWLSSHTKRIGKSNTPAQLIPSRNGPRLAAPSPKMHTTT